MSPTANTSSEQPLEPGKGRYQNEEAADPVPESSWGKLLPWIPMGALVLDVGCARGHFSAAVRRIRGGRVVGVEVDSAMAEEAKSRCDEVVAGDIGALLHADRFPRRFNAVLAADVLEHLLRPAEVLRGLARVLQPGGVVLASIPNVTHLSVATALAQGKFPRSEEGLLDSTHIQFFGETEVRELFRQSGYALRIVDRVRVDPRLTEFHTDLSGFPQEVLEFFDQNPNSTTYQFIIRAVPLEWATAEDRDEQSAPSNKSGSVKSRLVEELRNAETRLAEYHRVSTAREQAMLELDRRISEYHHALQEKDRHAVELDHKLADYHYALTSRAQEVSALQRQREQLQEQIRADATQFRKDSERWAQSLQELNLLRLRHKQPLTTAEQERLRVLYISDRKDAPFRYRCVSACEQLRDAGVIANILHPDAPELPACIASYSVIILFRLAWSERVEQIVRTARQEGCAIGFDIDDLIFRPEVEPLLTFLRDAPPLTISEYQKQFARLNQTLRQVDFCIAPTSAIAKHAALEHKPSFIHPNLIPSSYRKLSEAIYPLRPMLTRSEIIGYMSGSNTHDKDLAYIAEALRVVLERHPKLQLLLCGHVAVPRELKQFLSRIIRVPHLDYRLYPWLMARCRALLAPLEEVNDFANAKSALKVFEAGVFGVPVVASPTQSYIAAIENGVSGFVATSQDEWIAALDTLVEWKTSLIFGSKARQVALRDHCSTAYRFVLARLLLSHAGRALGPKPVPFAITSSSIDRMTPTQRMQQTANLIRDSVGIAAGSLSQVEMSGHGDMVQALSSDNRVAAMIACAQRVGNDLILDGRRIGSVLVDRERTLDRFEKVGACSTSGAASGSAFTSTTSDPFFLLGRTQEIGGDDELVMEMTVASPQPVFAQLFYSPSGSFNERMSIRFQLLADGRRHLYLLPIPRPWSSSSEGLLLRFDPVDRAVPFEVSVIASLTHDALRQEAHAPNVRLLLAERFLQGDGIEIGALQNPMAVPAKARVRYVDRYTLAEAREQYPELQDQPLTTPSILSDAETLEEIDSDSESFVICNHVLEHMKDPIGALSHWLRVLRPGGCLYLAVPDRSNQFDRKRDVTPFVHLLEDHRRRADRTLDDRAHYLQWTRSAHSEMSPAQQELFIEDLIRTDHRPSKIKSFPTR